MNQYLQTFFKFPQLSGISLECEQRVTEKKIFEALRRMPHQQIS